MKRRVTSLLLVLAMLLSMLPAMAFAADETTTGHAITVSENTSFTTKQGAELVIKMTDLFTDGEGHSMTYALSGDNLGDHTKLADGSLHFTHPSTGTYTPTITATCANDSSVTAAATLKITVEAGEKGDESQYGYDETPQDSVRVWVTISSDGVPIVGHDGTVLSHLEVNVPYFDLGNQDLADFYRYGTENGSGSYIDDQVVKRPTALHLYLYMIGVYYLGLEPEQVTTGEVKIFGHDGVGDGVWNMRSELAYEDTSLALNITGSATSMYMQQFWGHDENLMYYRNHVYPLMSAGWGSTADYVLLSDDDTIDLAMFSNWSFWSDGGAFACFDQDAYSVQPGKSIRFSTMKYDTKSVADGGTEQTEPITGLTVAVYDKDWTLVETVEPTMADGSDYTYTFATEGTYYLLAMDPNAGTSDARKAPATAKVTVGGGEKPFDPAEYYKVPRLIEGVSPTKEDTVQVGKAYLLSELQTGKVFEGPEGERIPYTQLYYQRSADGGETWGERMTFSESLFGGTTIQITELEAGTYSYRFTASTDGVHFSTDTWTLTLTVEKNPMMNFSFYVGKDYTGGYPIIKLYSVATDTAGNETLGEEITGCFRYSDFTATLPEGTEEYDPAQGTLVENYQMFYAPLRAGRYAYRAFAKNADTGEYDVALGGMILDLPTDGNVDGNAGGGTSIYLQCNSFYVESKKTDNTYFTADEYYIKLDCPIMGGSATMGEPYVKGNYTYYPTMLYAGGNACLYNSYAYPKIEGYIFTQAINQTFGAGYFAGRKSMKINTAVELTVTVPEEADFGLYFQWNNFNTTEVEPVGKTEDYDGWPYKEGTKKATYQISKSNSNYTWRLSDDTHVTEAGWLASQSANAEVSFSFAENAPTERHSHDFSKLGTQTKNRDEADLQINLDPTGYAAFDGTKRVRAYRHWQLINNDAGNIMVEPDFHWTVLPGGDATIKTVNGGNTTANWADITPGEKDSIITVYYDSIDVNPGKYGSHGGFYPATQPNRVGVIVVGGTGVTHGTADADVDFNMPAGVTTTRSMDWDYNYDTWFYGANETAPALDFAVTATGDVTVEYAFVTATSDMETVMQNYAVATAGEDGRYTVPLTNFRELGEGKGGTVILKMTDETGVSYRLVRVAEVTFTAENVSNPKEAIMPGDQVKLTFRGMYRAVNKISGIFNPTTFKPTYYSGGTKHEGTLGQYQRMDNASITVTIPENIEFAEGSETAEVRFTDGYTFGSMYSAANPFAFLYNMTDTGVGTNFNAVTVNYYMNHYADAVVTVSRKVLFDTALTVTDEAGTALEGVAIALTGPKGEAVTADENGRYQLGYGAYTYVLTKTGYVITRGGFSLGSADAEKLQDGVLTLTLAAMPAAGANPWDGKTKTEPQKDDSGAYRIGTAAELAWYAASDGKTAAKLTADIELAGFDWTPLKNLYAAFDGQGHVIRNLYINSSSYPVGLFGYVKTGASVTKLGVTGDVTCTNTSYAQAGGIAGRLESNASITECFSAVNVTSKKHAGGIAGYSDSSSVISDCYATGRIATTAANECYLGGICASGYSNTIGAVLTNCYFTGTVTGSGGNASYVGGVSCIAKEENYTNCCYLAGTVSGESPKYGVTGKGTAKTADELKALAPTLGDKFTADRNGVNSGYPVLAWQAEPALPAATATVDFTAQAAGAFLLAPAKNVTVSGDLAERYGYTDTIQPEAGVSALDVLVKAHELIFGEAFTAETKDTLLNVSASGTASVIFGEATMSNGFMVNHMYPHDGTPAVSGGGYNGTLLNNTVVKDGDLVEFFILQDTSFWLDSYGWFEQNGAYTRTVTAEAGKAAELTFKSAYFMMGYSYKDLAAMIAGGSATESAKLSTVNMQTGEMTDITGAVTGEDGKVSLTFAKPGEYVITAYMPKNEITENDASPLILSLTTVTVSEPTIVLGDVNGDGKVTYVDAALVYAHFNGKHTLPAERLAAADVNGDGKVTYVDAALIYALFNGKITEFPTVRQ